MAVVALPAIAAPTPHIVPGTFQAMGKEQVFEIVEIGTILEGVILFPANASMGQALVVLSAGRSRDRRIGRRYERLMTILRVAVANLCHGELLSFGT